MDAVTPRSTAAAFDFDGVVWRLRRGKRVLVTIERDATYPKMWWVRLPSGRVSDMLNLSRAKDFARTVTRDA